MVQTEALFVCLRQSAGGIRPSAILSVALQCPPSVLDNNTEKLRFQSQEIVDWFFGGADPEWLPEHLLYEEVEEIVEEIVEEYVLDEDDDDEEEDDEDDDEDDGDDGDDEPKETFQHSVESRPRMPPPPITDPAPRNSYGQG